MTINLMQISTAVKTMSSREIAELCNKEHRHVMRDIDTLNQSYEKLGLPKVGQGYYTHPNTGNQQHRQFLLSKEQTVDLMTGYNRELRILINRRWQELEAQSSQPVVQLPNFSNPVEAARAWANEVEQKQIAIEQVNELAPKAEALDRISHLDGALGIRETAQAVGMKQNEFVAWCIDENKPVSRRFMYREKFSGRLKAYGHRVQQGYISQKLNYFIDKQGLDCAKPQIKFTPAGITKIAEILQKEKQAEEVAPCTI